MANSKESEAEFAALCKRLNIWAHKWPDPRYGTNGSLNFQTIHDTKGPTGSIVDYLCFVPMRLEPRLDVAVWVECKGQYNTTNMPFNEIQPHQRRFLSSFMDKGVCCWLFFLLGRGDPRKDDGRKAYIVEWDFYQQLERTYSERSKGRKSWGLDLETVMSDAHMDRNRLVWKSGWTIPVYHPVVEIFPDLFNIPPIIKEPMYEENR